MKYLHQPLHKRSRNRLKTIVSPQQRSQKIGIRLDQLRRNLEDMAQNEVFRGILAKNSGTETKLRLIQQVQILWLQGAQHRIAELRKYIRQGERELPGAGEDT